MDYTASVALGEATPGPRPQGQQPSPAMSAVAPFKKEIASPSSQCLLLALTQEKEAGRDKNKKADHATPMSNPSA